MIRPFDTIILAGGIGSRLRPVVSDRPKCLALIHGRPFLAYLLDQLEAAGIREVLLSTGYLAEMVEQTFGAQHGKIALSYSKEESQLGTGGGTRQALSHCKHDLQLIINGDSYFHFDWLDFFNWFDSRAMNVGMVLAWVENGLRYGQVQIGDQGEVLAFREKGASEQAGWINAGIYLIKRQLLEPYAVGQPFSLEKDFFPAQLGAGFLARGYHGKFIDIGTPESYREAEQFFRV